MKLKKARIIVESIDETSKRWEKALQGKAKSRRDEEIITVSSWEILARVLAPSRLQILAAIAQLRPESIAQLARAMKKDFKNVHTDVWFLADLGLIDLKEQGTRKTLVPVAKYSEIDVPFAA